MDMNWRKSSRSSTNGGACIEVGASAPIVAVRDTKQEGMAERDTLKFSPVSWAAFTAKLK